jgi:hypothetical protein
MGREERWMMVPEMSGLQFFAIQLLFGGPQGGAFLREAMLKKGVKVDPPGFTRLMQRMEKAGYVLTRTEHGPSGCRLVSPRQFEITDLGLSVWRQVRAFYADAAEPPDALLISRLSLNLFHRQTRLK